MFSSDTNVGLEMWTWECFVTGILVLKIMCSVSAIMLFVLLQGCLLCDGSNQRGGHDLERTEGMVSNQTARTHRGKPSHT